MNLKSKITSILLALGLAVLGVVAGPAGTAKASQNAASVWVFVRGDLSQSNMLFSFENKYTYVVSQGYVAENGCAGEHGGFCSSWTTSEPQNMWVNPGWCSGYRYVVKNLNTGTTAYNQWYYHRGGYNGQSVWINPGGGLPATYDLKIETYLVPNGVAGCQAYA